MRFIAFSDIHACNYKSFAKYTNGVNSRLSNVLKSVECIQSEGKRLDVDFYLFGGDLFHTQGYIENDVFNLTYDAFSKFEKPVICISGNHDTFHSNNEKDLAFLKFGKLPKVTILSNGESKSLNGAVVYGFGYNENFNIEDIVKQVHTGDAQKKIVLIHQTPLYCKLNDYVFDVGVDYKKIENKVDLILFGHIHQPQQLSEKSYVIGSPLQSKFADIGNRGFWLIEDVGNKLVPTFHSIDLPKFITADRVTEEIKKDTKNYYRILHLDVETDNIIGISQKNTAINDRDIVNSTMSLEAIVNRYLDFHNIEQLERTNYQKYGQDILQKADNEFQPIIPSDFRLENVTIEGFLSFKDKVEFKIESGVWLILGECDEFTSNGAGKSSLFDAIFWCLYNQTTKGISSANVINDELDGHCRVVLQLIDNKTKNKLIIDRFRKYQKLGTGLKLIYNDKEIEGTASLLDRKLINILGFDYDFFLNTVYYSQEKTEFFASSTDSVKKSFLDSVLQTSKYDIALKLCRQDVSVNDSENKKYVLLNESLNNQIKKTEENMEMLHKKSILFEVERNDKLIVWEKELSDITNIIAEFDTKNKNTKSVLKSISVDLIAISGSQNKINFEYLNKKNDVREIISLLTQENKLANNNKGITESKIYRINSLSDNSLCENCGNVITEQSKGKVVKELTVLIEQYTNVVNKNNNKLKILQEELEVIENEYKDKIKNVLSNKKDLESKISLLEKEIDNIESELNDYYRKKTVLEKETDRCKNDVNTYSIEIEVNKKSITDKNNEIVNNKIVIDGLINTKKILTFWEMAFSNKGIKSLLFDEFCRLFNSEIGISLSLLSNNYMSVILQNQTRLASGELSEKMSLKVTLFGKEKDYVNLSGGEKRRVDIAVMVTLNKIIRKMYNISLGLLGILILDEIFSSLDDSGEENVYNLLEELSNSINSIYVITHTDELKSYFNNSIVVKKKNRCSFIEKNS